MIHMEWQKSIDVLDDFLMFPSTLTIWSVYQKRQIVSMFSVLQLNSNLPFVGEDWSRCRSNNEAVKFVAIERKERRLWNWSMLDRPDNKEFRNYNGIRTRFEYQKQKCTAVQQLQPRPVFVLAHRYERTDIDFEIRSIICQNFDDNCWYQRVHSMMLTNSLNLEIITMNFFYLTLVLNGMNGINNQHLNLSSKRFSLTCLDNDVPYEPKFEKNNRTE